MIKGPGLVQVYTGDGKGKTSAALGLALRAIGQGFKVYMIQFMKSGDTGELFSIKKHLPNMTIVQFGKDALKDTQLKMFQFDGEGELKQFGNGYFHFPPDREECEPARRGLEHAFNVIMSGRFDLVILDEINCIMNRNLLAVDNILKLLNDKPDHVEIVLTGRNAPQEIKDRADLVTEMCLRKHYFEKGINARRGIEF